MSAVAEKLREARALIAEGWTQGVFARDALGNLVYTHSEDAVCYCSTGAINRAFGPNGDNYEQRRGAWACLESAIGDDDIEDWNDAPERTQTEVLAAFDKAIQLAEGEAR